MILVHLTVSMEPSKYIAPKHCSSNNNVNPIN